MRRSLVGTTAVLASTAGLTAMMLPLRSHLSIATTALVLVIPVVIGVVTGGFLTGAVSVVAGFLVYDFFFIPPYLTLAVGAPENWAALGVYVAVMLPVSQVVAGMQAAKSQARRQGREVRELFELSHLLVEDKPLDVLLSAVVATVAEVFDMTQVAILLPESGGLAIVASAGTPLSDAQLRRVVPATGQLATLDAGATEHDDLLTLALAAAGRPIGLLVVSDTAATHHEREPLRLFANHIALAVERVQLRDQALQARLAEEVARLAKTLVTAVSHDLRAPLSAIKASSSTLADAELVLKPDAARQLATTIDVQADRLADLVQNLLDMSRIQAGVLRPRRTVAALVDVVTGVINDLESRTRGHQILVDIPDDLPPVDADLVLINRVITNLLENALRHSPKFAPVVVQAAFEVDVIRVCVVDRGPGVDPERRDEIFELFHRRENDAGAGLGLTIAKTFVEAHGQRIWVRDAPGGGATFCFTLRIPVLVPEAR
jgi:two-component system, OmpR family, sensor histidine kinase KdpD